MTRGHPESTLTRLVNLGHQAVHSPTHHRIHSLEVHRGCALGRKATARPQRWRACKKTATP